MCAADKLNLQLSFSLLVLRCCRCLIRFQKKNPASALHFNFTRERCYDRSDKYLVRCIAS